MSATVYRTLRNTSGLEQWIMHKGNRFAINGHGEESFDKEIADKFLENCGPVVVDVTIDRTIGDAFAPELAKQTTWLANMSGDPDAPKTKKIKKFVKNDGHGQYVMVEAANVNAEPRDFMGEMKGGHEQWWDEAGLVQKSLPTRILIVPKFKRVPFPKTEAEFLKNLDSTSQFPGTIIESRPPSDFEPDMSWKLSDIQAYCRLIDGSMDIGENELMLAKKAKEDEKQGVELLRQAKQMLLRRLYFRIVDPNVKLPSRTEFSEFVTGKSEEQMAKEELEQLMASVDVANKKAEAKLQRESKRVG